jgi:hypothetical protein
MPRPKRLFGPTLAAFGAALVVYVLVAIPKIVKAGQANMCDALPAFRRCSSLPLGPRRRI